MDQHTLAEKTTRAFLLLLGLAACARCCAAQPEPIPAYPWVRDGCRYEFELVRMTGEVPDVGQLSDIAYVGKGVFQVAGARGMFFFAPQGDSRNGLGNVIMYDPPPGSTRPQEFQLVDLDADGRFEVLTRPDALTGPLALFDESGRCQWTAISPAGGPALTDMALVLQADGDPPLEVLQVYDWRHFARLIQHDGEAGVPLSVTDGKASLWDAAVLDVDGDAVDELVWAIHESVVLWSFAKGELARVELDGGRAFAFHSLFEQPDTRDTFAWRIYRFRESQMGHSVLTLRRTNEEWVFEVSEFQTWQQARADDGLFSGAELSPDGRFWVFATWGQWIPEGEDRAQGCGVIHVGSVGEGVFYHNAVTSDPFPAPKNKATAIAVNPDSEVPLEVWAVYGKGVSRVRVTEK